MDALFAWLAFRFSIANLSFNCSTSEASSFSCVFERVSSRFLERAVSSSSASKRDLSTDSDLVSLRSLTKSSVAELS